MRLPAPAAIWLTGLGSQAWTGSTGRALLVLVRNTTVLKLAFLGGWSEAGCAGRRWLSRRLSSKEIRLLRVGLALSDLVRVLGLAVSKPRYGAQPGLV